MDIDHESIDTVSDVIIIKSCGPDKDQIIVNLIVNLIVNQNQNKSCEVK